MLENLQHKKIILASKSPRRQELLKGLDIAFEIRTKDVDESYSNELQPEQVPVFLAEKKANAFNQNLKPDEIIITSDTIVIRGLEILEKPKSTEEAIQMVSKLSGNMHKVVTGVCIQSLEQKISFSDETIVHFSTLSVKEIEYYVNKYQPFDKAGSYGVQEWVGYVGIERLEGSYYNVMGLPVHKVYNALKTF